ncbi:type II toxin-antitoxin system PemK/MazF family toxin [Clostridium botulinum]|nr:type II toxin-antitoxin system PemK/MazF family toxin [Clostridium botulinum]EKS4395945.1 type II toxin-antitoxin system PemK/MazF family toxin [Clostridium botulinum]
MKKLKNNKNPKRGEVWYVKFPLEEDENKTLPRPVIVLEDHDEVVGVLSIKVTKHKPRDKWDYELFYWKEAKLRMKSTARIAKALYLNLDMFDRKFGDLHEEDLKNVDNLFNEYLLDKKI